jgi:hypothetical protein
MARGCPAFAVVGRKTARVLLGRESEGLKCTHWAARGTRGAKITEELVRSKQPALPDCPPRVSPMPALTSPILAILLSMNILTQKKKLTLRPLIDS